MKKITLLTFLLTSLFGFSQTYTLLDNFDAVVTGTTWIDDNGSTTSTIESAPISGSNMVASDGNYGQIITEEASAPWQAGALILQDNYIDLANQRTMQVDVYSDVTTWILAKAVGVVGGGGSDGATHAEHPGGGWATLTFDFDNIQDNPPSGASNSEFESIFFFPNWNGAGWDGNADENGPSPVTTTLYDNVKGLVGSAIPPDPQVYDLIDNFDAVVTGTTWLDDNGSTTSTVESAPISGSNMVASDGNYGQIITEEASAPWQAGALILQDNYIDLANQRTMQVDVYSDATTWILAKAVGVVGGGGSDGATHAEHPGGGWATLTFDFDDIQDNPPSGASNSEFESIFFFPNWNGAGWDGNADENGPSPVTTTLYDNIRGLLGAAITPDDPDPEAAPIPTAPDGETYSIYNDTNSYSTVFPFAYDFGTIGGEPDLDTGAGENKALRFDFTFAGYGQGEGGPDDVSAYGFVHFMYWAEVGVPGFQFRLISNDGGFVESTYEIGTQEAIVNGQWIQVSIPMTYFTNLGFSSTNLFQWKFDPFMQVITDPGKVFIDNIILTQNPLSVDEFDTASFKAYPNPTSTNWNITSNNPISKVTVYDVLGKVVRTLTFSENEVQISSAGLNSGIYFAKLESTKGTKTIRLIKE